MISSGLSRSRQYAALSLLGKVLYPLLEVNADDQGRLSADAERVKWTVCPNVHEIPAERIPDLLAEMQRAALAIIYDDGPEPVIQLTQWWADQSTMQWAYPSEFIPAGTWDDRLRFRGKNRVITINWPGVTDKVGDTPLAQLVEEVTGPPSLGIALGKALGRRQYNTSKDKLSEEYPPNPPKAQAAPAQRPHAGQGRGKEKPKEAPHGRVRRRRLAADPRVARLPWTEVTGGD